MQGDQRLPKCVNHYTSYNLILDKPTASLCSHEALTHLRVGRFISREQCLIGEELSSEAERFPPVERSSAIAEVGLQHEPEFAPC